MCWPSPRRPRSFGLCRPLVCWLRRLPRARRRIPLRHTAPESPARHISSILHPFTNRGTPQQHGTAYEQARFAASFNLLKRLATTSPRLTTGESLTSTKIEEVKKAWRDLEKSEARFRLEKASNASLRRFLTCRALYPVPTRRLFYFRQYSIREYSIPGSPPSN